MCRTKTKKVNVHKVSLPQEEKEDTMYKDYYYVGAVNKLEKVKTRPTTASNEWALELNIRGQVIRAKIDTGAQVNVMSKRTADSIEAKLEPNSANLTSYSGTAIPVVGQVMVPCFYKKRKFLI